MIPPHYNTVQVSNSNENSGKVYAAKTIDESNVLANKQEAVLNQNHRDNEANSCPSLTPSKHSVKNNKKRGKKANKNKRSQNNNDKFKDEETKDNHDENEEPKGKRRKVEKKPMDMPRRALSAYNIFFSEQRKLILEAIDSKEQEKDNEKNEEDNASVTSSSSSDSTTEPMKLPKKIRQPDGIPCVSSHRVSSLKRTKRLHRKVHGKINLVVLVREVSKRWKELSDEDRKYYNDLAAEDKIRHTQAMKEYKELKAAEGMLKIKQDHHLTEVQQNQPTRLTIGLRSKDERSYTAMRKPAHVDKFHHVHQNQPHYRQHPIRHQLYASGVAANNVEFQRSTLSPPDSFGSAFHPSRQVPASSAFDMYQSNAIPLTDSERMMIMKCRAAAAAASTKTMMHFVSAHGWHSPVEPSMDCYHDDLDSTIRPRMTSV